MPPNLSVPEVQITEIQVEWAMKDFPCMYATFDNALHLWQFLSVHMYFDCFPFSCARTKCKGRDAGFSCSSWCQCGVKLDSIVQVVLQKGIKKFWQLAMERMHKPWNVHISCTVPLAAMLQKWSPYIMNNCARFYAFAWHARIIQHCNEQSSRTPTIQHYIAQAEGHLLCWSSAGVHSPLHGCHAWRAITL